jgi:hypothetical protein
MPPEEFEAEFHTSPDTLTLPSGDVCVTRMACGDEGPMPGSLVVHGRGELLLLWDGVWFRATRQSKK